MEIKTVNRNDYQKIDALIRNAFTNTENGYGNEAALVDAIRKSQQYIRDLEIVAIEDDTIIGHGLLSEVAIVNQNYSYTGLVLAPLEVAADHQGKGIGKKLMEELEMRAQYLDYPFISILGHADYYRKFGYVPASKFNVNAPFDVPDEVFMLKPLYDGGLTNISGVIKYSKAFESF